MAATCTCPICGQTATCKGFNSWAGRADIDIALIWYCPNCDYPWWGGSNGINEDEARRVIEDNELGICSTCHAPFGPEYEGQKICRVCERKGQLSLFAAVAGREE